MAKRVRTIFFDAGNTLLYPRVDELAEELTAAGLRANVDDFRAAERDAKRGLDEWLQPKLAAGDLPALVDRLYWAGFLRALAERLHVGDDRNAWFTHRVIERFRDIQFWSYVYPETEPVLANLRNAGYYLGVISNSVGTMEQQLGRTGLAPYFRAILDSAVVGVEKPNPRIFHLALEAAQALPEEALFVGDTYSTDVAGARLAGMRAVLMDRFGIYNEPLDCPRITSLDGLERVLRGL